MPSGGNCLTVKVKEEEWTNAENDEIMEKIHNAWENNKQNDACLKTTRDVFVENNINLWARKLFSRTMDDNSPIDAYLNRSSEYSVLHFPKTIVSGQ
jgi:predicted RNA binding protein with dsRBD fold (UPF0201 family)